MKFVNLLLLLLTFSLINCKSEYFSYLKGSNQKSSTSAAAPCPPDSTVIDNIVKGNPFALDDCNTKLIEKGNAQYTSLMGGKELSLLPKDIEKYYNDKSPYWKYKHPGCKMTYGEYVDNYDVKHQGGSILQEKYVSYYIKDCSYLDNVWSDYNKYLARSKVSACVTGFSRASPPAFCWKRIFEKQECGMMSKCGPLACAQNAGTCASAISYMVLKTAKFTWDLAWNAATGGLSKTLVETLQGYIGTDAKEYGIAFIMYAIQSGFESFLKKSSGNEDKFKKAMLQEAQKIDRSTNKAICDAVYEHLKPKAPATKERFKEFLKKMRDYVKDFKADSTGVSALKDCQTDGKANIIACTNAILGIVGVLDPTGMISLVTAFIYPQCPRNINLKFK